MATKKISVLWMLGLFGLLSFIGCAGATPTAISIIPTSVPPTVAVQPTTAPTALPQPTAAHATAVPQPTAASSPTQPAQPTPLAASCSLRLGTIISTEYSGIVHTVSYNDGGLLPGWLGDFQRRFNCTVNLIAFSNEKASDMTYGDTDFAGWKGSITISKEQPLELARDGKADVLFVHSDAQTDQFLKDGDAIESLAVVYGDYVIVGPKADPAKVGSAKSAQDAFKQIAAMQSPFVSRGDGSETNVRELSIWERAGISPTQQTWYHAVGKDMDKTLGAANDLKAYTLVNRVICLTLCTLKTNLKIVYGGATIKENTDEALYDHYVVMVVNPAKHPGVNAEMAQKLAGWFTSPEMQTAFGTPITDGHPDPIFLPDAK